MLTDVFWRRQKCIQTILLVSAEDVRKLGLIFWHCLLYLYCNITCHCYCFLTLKFYVPANVICTFPLPSWLQQDKYQISRMNESNLYCKDGMESRQVFGVKQTLNLHKVYLCSESKNGNL